MTTDDSRSARSLDSDDDRPSLDAWLAAADPSYAPTDAASASCRAGELGLFDGSGRSQILADRIVWPTSPLGRIGVHLDLTRAGSDVRSAIDRARSLGATAIWLSVANDGEWAIAVVQHLLRNCGSEMTSIVIDTDGDVAGASALREQLALSENELERSLVVDPLGDLARTGGPVRVDASLGAAVDVMRVGASRRTLAISTGWARRAGAGAEDELAAALAVAADYLRVATQRGIDVETFARHVVFRFDVGLSLVDEIAKLRAARLLWAHLLAVCDPDAARVPMQLHALTSLVDWSTLDPWNNVLRATISATAARIGGADVVYHAPMDALDGGSRVFTQRLALNGDLILHAEAGLDRVVDPAAGSYAIEHHTATLVGRAWDLFSDLERQGGVRSALDRGEWARAMRDRATARTQRLEAGDEVLVGVNRYQRATWPAIPCPVPVSGDSPGANEVQPNEGGGPGLTVPACVASRPATTFEAGVKG